MGCSGVGLWFGFASILPTRKTRSLSGFPNEKHNPIHIALNLDLLFRLRIFLNSGVDAAGAEECREES